MVDFGQVPRPLGSHYSPITLNERNISQQGITGYCVTSVAAFSNVFFLVFEEKLDHKFVDHKLLQDWVTVYVYVLRNMMLIWQAAYIYRKAT